VSAPRGASRPGTPCRRSRAGLALVAGAVRLPLRRRRHVRDRRHSRAARAARARCSGCAMPSRARSTSFRWPP
jgi:hypothetical protein